MVRLFPVNEFTARKKVLLLQSEIHRRTLRLQVATAQQSFAQFQKRFAVLGISSVALSLGASVAGLLLAKKKLSPGGAPATGGIFSKVLSGISVFNQVKSFFSRAKTAANNSEGSSE